jgi:hypothetical protein
MTFYDQVRNVQSGHKVQVTFYDKVRNGQSGRKSSGDF